MTHPLEPLAASWVRVLRVEGKADQTIYVYRRAVADFITHLSVSGYPVTTDSLTKLNCRDYQVTLIEQGLANSTVNVRLCALKRWTDWLAEEELLATAPMAKTKWLKLKYKPVPLVDDDALAKLIAACRGSHHRDRRNMVIIRLLMHGLRASEVINLTIENVDLDNSIAKILDSKGGKSRIVYLSPKTVVAIDRYLRVRGRYKRSDLPNLVLSQQGVFTRTGLRGVIDKLCVKAGLPHIHAHQFRHSWASDALMSGMQANDLMRLAGWSSPTMLLRYGAVAADKRAEAAARRFNREDRV